MKRTNKKTYYILPACILCSWYPVTAQQADFPPSTKAVSDFTHSTRESVLSYIQGLRKQAVCLEWDAVYQTLTSSTWNEQRKAEIITGMGYIKDVKSKKIFIKEQTIPDNAIVELMFIYAGQKKDPTTYPILRFYSPVLGDTRPAVTLRYTLPIIEETSITNYLHYGKVQLPYKIYQQIITEPQSKHSYRIFITVDNGPGTMLQLMLHPAMPNIPHFLRLGSGDGILIKTTEEQKIKNT